MERILKAASANSQFGWIVTDKDVSDFLARVAVTRRHEISDPEHLSTIDNVAEEQQERAAEEKD